MKSTIPWLIILVVLNFVWAGSYTVMKAATGSLHPFAVVFWRMLISAAILVLWCGLKGYSFKIKRKDFARMILVGLMSASAHFLVVAGINYSHASEASLLYVIEPVWGIVLATIVLKERFTRWMVLGLALILAGSAVMTISPGGAEADSSSQVSVFGNLLIFIGLLCEGSFSVVVKPVISRYPAPITLMIIVASASVFLAAPTFLSSPHVLPATLEEWGQVLYLAVFCSVIGYLGWIVIMRHVPVNVMYFTIFIQPISGPFFAWAFIGERFDTMLLFAAILLISGMAAAVISHVTHMRRTRLGASELAIDPA